jgi:hypothetical protein
MKLKSTIRVISDKGIRKACSAQKRAAISYFSTVIERYFWAIDHRL